MTLFRKVCLTSKKKDNGSEAKFPIKRNFRYLCIYPVGGHESIYHYGCSSRNFGKVINLLWAYRILWSWSCENYGLRFLARTLRKCHQCRGEIGKSERTVKQDVSYIMVDIYCAPGLYDFCSVVNQKKEGTVWYKLQFAMMRRRYSTRYRAT